MPDSADTSLQGDYIRSVVVRWSTESKVQKTLLQMRKCDLRRPKVGPTEGLKVSI